MTNNRKEFQSLLECDEPLRPLFYAVRSVAGNINGGMKNKSSKGEGGFCLAKRRVDFFVLCLYVAFKLRGLHVITLAQLTIDTRPDLISSSQKTE